MEYEFLEHTSEIKFRAYGKTLNEVFENSLKAFSHFISKGAKIKSTKGKIIEVVGTDLENLLYNFLDELIYLLDAENFLVVKAEVLIRGNNLRAEVFGDAVYNYEGLDPIKAATYSEMYVKKTDDGWEAQVVMDV